MAKDKRYQTIKKLIGYGEITTFSEVLEIVPKTILTRDLGMHHATFGRLMANKERLMLKDIYRIASFIGVDRLEIVKLIFNERKVEEKENGKPKKKRVPSSKP